MTPCTSTTWYIRVVTQIVRQILVRTQRLILKRISSAAFLHPDYQTGKPKMKLTSNWNSATACWVLRLTTEVSRAVEQCSEAPVQRSSDGRFTKADCPLPCFGIIKDF